LKFNAVAIYVGLIILLTHLAFSESLMSLQSDGIPTGVEINIDTINFNTTVGGTDEKSFYLYNNGIFSENVTLRNFQGKASDWIIVNKSIPLSANEPSHRVSVILKVPSDVQPGLYQATFEVASSDYMRVVKVVANINQKTNLAVLTPLGIVVISFFAVIAMYLISGYFFRRQEREISRIRRRRHEVAA
jgi:uncharacterized membrane protein